MTQEVDVHSDPCTQGLPTTRSAATMDLMDAIKSLISFLQFLLVGLE